jgi:hypothetical protein
MVEFATRRSLILAFHGQPLPTSTTCPSVGSFHVKDQGKKVDVKLEVTSPYRTSKDYMDVDVKRNKHVVEGDKLSQKEVRKELNMTSLSKKWRMKLKMLKMMMHCCIQIKMMKSYQEMNIHVLKLMDPCLYILTIWTQYMELNINGSSNLHKKR